ncbi:uncharacterized protein C8Q71DRAFT_845546 [Rhodofomes roseus]|uniref:Uncharacterized protein n=1 Tax=Rhodofomes roseus TaxID=34475 RepID=A0ABQ8KX24_9APHY|nr:uncharacterized protein C8Q71DRAFT_845546 [Rhodofomes roseus]KAH9843223.1 hypothetical protein C8Q71DRAFT_845546 [Rhodofomes roseus]
MDAWVDCIAGNGVMRELGVGDEVFDREEGLHIGGESRAESVSPTISVTGTVNVADPEWRQIESSGGEERVVAAKRERWWQRESSGDEGRAQGRRRKHECDGEDMRAKGDVTIANHKSGARDAAVAVALRVATSGSQRKAEADATGISGSVDRQIQASVLDCARYTHLVSRFLTSAPSQPPPVLALYPHPYVRSRARQSSVVMAEEAVDEDVRAGSSTRGRNVRCKSRSSSRALPRRRVVPARAQAVQDRSNTRVRPQETSAPATGSKRRATPTGEGGEGWSRRKGKTWVEGRVIRSPPNVDVDGFVHLASLPTVYSSYKTWGMAVKPYASAPTTPSTNINHRTYTLPGLEHFNQLPSFCYDTLSCDDPSWPRGTSSNSLSPPEIVFPGTGSASPGTLPCSVLPLNGLTQFLSRPTNWFNRVTSDKASRSSISSNEPRSSTSSSGQKHKISHPTDPQPNPYRPAAEDERASSSRSQAAKHRRTSPMSSRASTADDPHASSKV